MYGKGISKEGNILDVGVSAEIIRKAGSWYSYGDDKLGQGRENAKDFLRENPDIATEIERKVREKHGLEPIKDNKDNKEKKGKDSKKEKNKK